LRRRRLQAGAVSAKPGRRFRKLGEGRHAGATLPRDSTDPAAHVGLVAEDASATRRGCATAPGGGERADCSR
jgi:hypothetical protein